MLSHQETEFQQLKKLKTLLALCKANEQHMKSVNEYYREHGTVQGHPAVLPNAARIIDDGIKNGEFPDGLPFSTHAVLNNCYEIQRLTQRISALESRMDKFVGWEFPGGVALINTEKNRLQLKFYEGVGAIKQVTLTQHRFSWSPVENVWERKLSREAIRAAACIKFVRPHDGKSPENLQPYARKDRERESR